MCTIGYHKKLNLIFKNRDKFTNVNEVILVKPDFLAVKTEGAHYYSLGVNSNGCGFVSAAVNTPEWTALVLAGKKDKAALQFKKENKGLSNPIEIVSRYFHETKNVDEWLEKLLNSKGNFMGYNVLLAEEGKAAWIELYKHSFHVSWLKENSVITNHFFHLRHGPQTQKDYISSFNRLKAAANLIKESISIEDVFQMLKTKSDDGEEGIWREGVFSTISSSVIDLEAKALYYAFDHRKDYARITTATPPKGAEKIFIEMSRYIDLPTYHNIERGHPFYVEMIEEILLQIKKYFDEIKVKAHNKDIQLTVLELGAGTGLCSLELLKLPFIKLDALDIDSECCKMLSSHPEASKCNIILGDAAIYCKKHHYDMVVSTFAHDHIHYNKRFLFAQNIYNNLKKGGIYIMGGELLTYFSNDTERKKALFRYHNYIIDLALQHNRVQLSELENNALKSGLDMVGDFKRHETMFEDEMKSAGFRCLLKNKIGPLDNHEVGGIFVYVFKAE